MDKKIALITGGAKGIGAAISLKLAEDGFKIAINYNSSSEAAQKLQKQIEDKGGECIIIKANVSNLNEVQELISKVEEKFGGINILVNNAGITRDGLLLKMSEENFDDVINVNLKSVFNTSKTIVRSMLKQRWGRIINISSVIGIGGNAGQANYAASKAGINAFTKSLSKEIASRNITVNAICPGFIESDMTMQLNDSVRDVILNQIPAKKFGTPLDVANLVSFIASEDSSYITGQTIRIDGGMIL